VNYYFWDEKSVIWKVSGLGEAHPFFFFYTPEEALKKIYEKCLVNKRENFCARVEMFYSLRGHKKVDSWATVKKIKEGYRIAFFWDGYEYAKKFSNVKRVITPRGTEVHLLEDIIKAL